MSDKDTQKRTSAEEWRALFAQMGEQVRREAARTVGADEDADWKTIGRETDDAARRTAAKAVGAGEEAEWDEIGKAVERSSRRGIARVVGATPEADWPTIGQEFETKLNAFFKNVFAKPKPQEVDRDETDDVIDPWA
jgi:hypothetical protein